MHIDAGGERFIAARHHRACERAKPRLVEIEIDEQYADETGDAGHHPGGWKALSEQIDRPFFHGVAGERMHAGAQRHTKLAAGNGTFARAPGDCRDGFDHLAQAEEQDDRQHLRIARFQKPRHQQIVKRQANETEDNRAQRDGRDRIKSEERVAPEGEIGAKHQEVAVRKVDDAHDTEDEVQTEADEAEIQPVQQSREHRIDKHAIKHGGRSHDDARASRRCEERQRRSNPFSKAYEVDRRVGIRCKRPRDEASASRPRIDGLAVRLRGRVQRLQSNVPVIIGLELPERGEFADLRAHRVEFERPVDRLQLARLREHRTPQFQLIEARHLRHRLFQDEAGRIAGNRVETELDLSVGIFFLPRIAELRQRHADLDFVFVVDRGDVGQCRDREKWQL